MSDQTRPTRAQLAFAEWLQERAETEHGAKGDQEAREALEQASEAWTAEAWARPSGATNDVQEDRRAIAKWLRGQADWFEGSERVCGIFADAIEKGQHMEDIEAAEKEEPPKLVASTRKGWSPTGGEIVIGTTETGRSFEGVYIRPRGGVHLIVPSDPGAPGGLEPVATVEPLPRPWGEIYSERAELARGKTSATIRARIAELTTELRAHPESRPMNEAGLDAYLEDLPTNDGEDL